jgi:hypothetical protein
MSNTNPIPEQRYSAPPPTTGTPGQGMAITSLVLGCVGIVMFWLFAIVPVLAIIFGGVAINQAKKAGAKPSGMGVAGLVLGIVFTAIYALIILVAVAGA